MAMNFDDIARSLTLKLDKMKSLGGRKELICVTLMKAYHAGRRHAVQAIIEDLNRLPKAKPPLTFEVKEGKS
jgi:hypothetical protein